MPCIKPTGTNQTVFPKPTEAQETPSVDKDGKQHEQNGKSQQKKQKKTPKEQSKKEGSSKQAKGISEVLIIYYVRHNLFVLTNSNTCPISREFMSIVQIMFRWDRGHWQTRRRFKIEFESGKNCKCEETSRCWHSLCRRRWVLIF